MSNCRHVWEMTNVQFGFVIFEKCNHCNRIRTYFSAKDFPAVGEEYREGEDTWRCMENAQSFRFDLICRKCRQVEKFYDILAFLYCTSCLPKCKIEKKQKKLEAKKTWVMVAFGHLPRSPETSLSRERLKILEKYFNQRRDTGRSRIAILSYDLIDDFSKCKGEFIHDIGMLSYEPQEIRTPLTL
ncbi:MAG: hypothetical protein Kow0042_17260 [Calditrichia bacterium]